MQVEAALKDARNYSENIVDTVRQPLVVLNAELKIISANRSFYNTFQVTSHETIGKFIYDLGNRQWDIPALRLLLEEILPQNTVIEDYEVEHDFFGIGHKIILLNAREIFREDIGSNIILLAMEDITERMQVKAALKDARNYAENIVDTVRQPLVVLNAELKIISANRSFYNTFQVTSHETIGKFIYELGNRQWDIPALRLLLEEILPQNTVIKDYEVEHDFFGIGHKIILLNAREIFREDIGSNIILLAMEDITERKQAAEHVKQALQEKTVMLKEIHHRVKNNLTVVYSLLGLQARQITNPVYSALFEESRNRVMSMSLIHKMLYRSENLAYIDFNKYLQTLTDGIALSYTRQDVAIHVDTAQLALDINIGIPCGLIVNELVSNCFKYAFPEGRTGEIRLGLSHNNDGDNVLTVGDNGVGLPDALDFQNSSSLGLELVNVLTTQIHGTITLSKTAGTVFSITFPVTTATQDTEHG